VSGSKDTRGNNCVKSALWPEGVTSRKRGSPSEMGGVPAVALFKEVRTWGKRLGEEAIFITSFWLP